MTVPKPRGRRPGNCDTRFAIRQAALSLFSRFGYDKVSLRAVAREADVDPALIHHYFESKADLFSQAVLDIEFRAEVMLQHVLECPREAVGTQVIQEFIRMWNSEGASERFNAMFFRAMSGEVERRPLVEFLNREVLTKVAEAHGHTNAATRANLASSVLLGMVIARDIVQVPSFRSIKEDELTRGVGAALQQLLVEAW